MDKDEFNKIDVGDILEICSDLDVCNSKFDLDGYALVGPMLNYAGNVARVTNIVKRISTGETIAVELEGKGTWKWNRAMIKRKIEIPEMNLKDDDRSYKDFKVGDLVKIRSLENFRDHFFETSLGDFMTKQTFVKSARKFCDKKAIITYKNENRLDLKFLGMKRNEYEDYRFSDDMIEIVEEGHMKKNTKIKKMRKPRNMSDEDIIKEMISKVDVTKMKKILASSLRVKATELKGLKIMLEDWAKAKKDLYILLGKNLKVCKEIEYQAGESEWKENVNILSQKFPAIFYMLDSIPTKCFSDNVYRPFSSNMSRLIPDAKNGMKLSTFLSKAVSNPKFDIEYSKIMDSSKIKGKIVLSIDPIDFILMSFNNSGWTSCHTISHGGESRNFGEFVSGIFSYICDKSTMIAFRHSDKICDYSIGHSKFQDISKNWRELFYIDTNTYAFCSSRQYPKYDENISKEVRTMLEEIICNKLKIENKWKVQTISSSGELSKYMEDVVAVDYPLHYNDMLHGFEGKLVYNKALNNLEATKMIIGSKPVCLICGKNILENSSHPYCLDCS